MKINKKQVGIIVLAIIALFISNRYISYLRTTQLKYLADKPESKNYIVQQLTTDDILDLWYSEQDSTCIIKTGNFDFNRENRLDNIKYWIINIDGQLLYVADSEEEVAEKTEWRYFNGYYAYVEYTEKVGQKPSLGEADALTGCFNKSWYSIEGISYQNDNPNKFSIRQKGYYRKGLVYNSILNFLSNSVGSYWGATGFYKMKHNGETIRFKECATLDGLISFIDLSPSIKLYCPTSRTKIIWLEGLRVNSDRLTGETCQYDRPKESRGVYVVAKK